MICPTHSHVPALVMIDGLFLGTKCVTIKNMYVTLS